VCERDRRTEACRCTGVHPTTCKEKEVHPLALHRHASYKMHGEKSVHPSALQASLAWEALQM